MAEHNDQRIKLLRLVEILRSETDENHPLTTRQLCDRLIAMHISCDRRTLSEDMDFLNRNGFEVLDVRVGHAKAYYMVDRSFSDPELKILIDAVQAASFITEKKSAELTEKIAVLGGSHRADILRSNLVHFNTRKHTNEAIYYNVGALEQAILQEKQVSFLYFDLDENHKRIYRNGSARRTVDPVSLIYSDDTYYLICFDDDHADKRATYRVDRMEQVNVEPTSACIASLLLRSKSAQYTTQAFSMYGGPSTQVVLEFDRALLGPVYDRFGEQTPIRQAGRTTFTATVTVCISPTFYAWLFQFGGKMHIVSPESARQEYRAMLDGQRRLYRKPSASQAEALPENEE